MEIVIDEKEVFMVRTKECKHSVVYTADPDVKNPPLRSVYVDRSFAGTGEMPQAIRVRIAGFNGVTGGRR